MSGFSQQTQNRSPFRCVVPDEISYCPIEDLMSIPLDRLGQLAWPFLQCSRCDRCSCQPLKAPSVSQSDIDDTLLARVIEGTVAEVVRPPHAEICWGPVTSHCLRALLFQKVLQGARERAAVVPQEQTAEASAPIARQLDVQPGFNAGGERRSPEMTEDVSPKAQRRLSESAFTSQETSFDAAVNPEGRVHTSLGWIVPYLQGKQDDVWLQSRVKELVVVAALPQNDGQKQLVCTAASLSVQALHHKKSAKAFLNILREVLERWNEAPETTGENGIFGFNVVLPMLHITCFTKLCEADVATVAHLLERVRGPPRSCGFNAEPLSTATFVTKHTLFLDTRSISESPFVSPLSADQGEGSLTTVGGAHSTIRSATIEVDLPVELLGQLEPNPPVTELSWATRVFLNARMARRVTLHIRKAVNCDDVQIALIPYVPLEDESTIDETYETGKASDIVWLEPTEEVTRELSCGCSCVLRYRKDCEGLRITKLEVDVRQEICVEVDSRWVEEFRSALSAAQLETAAYLLRQLNTTPVVTKLKKESIMLFPNGIQPRTEARVPPPLVEEIAKMDDAALQKRIMCHRSDVASVRAVLCMIGNILAESEPNQLTWGSRVWQDVIMRVSRASSVIGGNTDACDMAVFVSEQVAPCQLSVAQIVDGIIALFSSNITVSQLREFFVTQSERAMTCIRFLRLLLRAKESFVPKDMFSVVSLLRDLMTCVSDHYLLQFIGCGGVLTEEIRVLVHRLLTAVFTALQHVMSLPGGERRRLRPHRFLWEKDEFGPFAVVSLSLLATPLDERDLDFILHRIISQVEGLLPSFTDFGRTASFRVDEVEERSVIKSMRALVGDGDTHKYGRGTPDSVQRGCSGGVDCFVGHTMVGAIEGDQNVWVPSGSDAVCYTSTPLYFPGAQWLPFSSAAASLSSTVPSSALSSPRRTPLVSPPNVTSSVLCTADVTLTTMPLKGLLVSLASGPHSNITSNAVQGDWKGFYFEPYSGNLHHAGRVFSLPPLFRGDTITFCFPFSPKTSTRTVCLLVNGVRFASFPAPLCALYLLVGVRDSSCLEARAVRILFKSPELSFLGSVGVATGVHLAGMKEIANYCDCLPTRHFISMFATLVFAYLISLCTRRFAQVRQLLGGVGCAPILSLCQELSHDSSTAKPVQSEEAWGGFIDGCCGRLRQNVESLIDSIEHLPVVDDISDATERVKRSAASFVYDCFLMDYIAIMRTAIYCSSNPVDILTTLTKVVCSEEVGERARCAALTTIQTLLQEPSHNFGSETYDPKPLWDCCCRLSRHVTASTYVPRFTSVSAAADLRVVSGGRHIKSHTAEECSSRGVQNTISFASKGIPLDGSLGDVVSFSVRIKRGLEFDSLGRLYYIGVACPDSLPTGEELECYPGTRNEMQHVYAITDYFTDIEVSSVRIELIRHSKHWMLKKDGIIFGSGDVITVTVDTKMRCISFERNELSLGTLYTNIPPTVKVLFPFVEMYNKDATSSWMYMPCETGIRARVVMRAMLSRWNSILVPSLSQMLRGGEAIALQVLGADGDEMSFTYTPPPRSELKGSYNVRLVRQVGNLAEIILDGGNSGGITVPAVAVEPNYESVVSHTLPLGLFVNDIMGILSRSLTFRKGQHNQESIHIQSTKTFLYALRLLSEVEAVNAPIWDTKMQRVLLEQFIRILAAMDDVHSNGSQIVSEAWNELVLLSEEDELCLTVQYEGGDGDSAKADADEGNFVDNSGCCDNDQVDKGREIMRLRCPICDEVWGNCLPEDHGAPYSLCVTVHHIMQRLGLSSPFVGFTCEWLLVEEGFRLTLHATTENEVEGEGADNRGPFSFSGKYVSSHHLRGRCVYKCIEGSSNSTKHEEEWTCSVCTFINLSDSTRCAMCTTARPGATWVCLLCGYAFNPNRSNICTTCGNVRLGLTAAGESTTSDKKQAFCTGCGKMCEYVTFSQFESRHFCDKCCEETLWLPEERHIGVVEAKLVGAGDQMNWFVSFGGEQFSYTNIKNTAYSFGEMLSTVSAVSPSAGDLTRYVPPLMQCYFSGDGCECDLLRRGVPAHQRKRVVRSHRAVVPAIIYFSSRIVCAWGATLAPKNLAKFSVLRGLRVFEDRWLAQLKEVAADAAKGILTSCLRILLSGRVSEQTVWSLSSVCRVLMNCNPTFQKQRHYLLYALVLNVVRRADDRGLREVCYSALNLLLEEACGEHLNVQCLREVISIIPIVANQQQLMVHAFLRGVNVSISADVTLTSWLIEAGERMERGQPLPALFDEPSPDEIFPYIVELPDTRVGSGGELIVGQVRGSVGVLGNNGGRYYYEVVLPPDFDERGKTVVMGWGTIQHEIVNSGQHVGSDIHSWGFNCQDRLRIMTGEQTLVTPRPIVGGDVIGTLLDLDAMMMCWSVNGEELTWIAVVTQGKGEAIYPYVSAAMDPYGVLVRLSYTQFKPEGYRDFSPARGEDGGGRESSAKPQNFEFYLQLCGLVNEVTDYGFTLDSLPSTNTWMERGYEVLCRYPLLSSVVDDNSLEELKPYLQHLRSINSLAVSVAKSHEILRNSPFLTRGYERVHKLLFFAARWAIVERQIDRRLLRNNVRRYRQVLVDLNEAKGVLERGERMDFNALFHKSVTGQLFRQTHDSDVFRDAVMFTTRLSGEVADDAGGVTRSVVSMMCDELQRCDSYGGYRVAPLLPFFKLSNHSTLITLVPNVDFYRNNPNHRQLFLQFFTWLGKLVGNVTLSGYVMFSLNLPRLVWKFLTFDEITINDYYADIDDTVRGALNDDDFLLNDEYYFATPAIQWRLRCGVPGLVGATRSIWSSALVPSKGTTAVSAIDVSQDICRAKEAEKRRTEAEKALVHQYDELLSAMRVGITSVVAAHSLRRIRWDDLQQRVCGSPCTTAEDVMSSLDVSSLVPEIRDMLVEVVHSMSHKERTMFLRFCSGQGRIPLPEKVQVSCGDDPSAFPTAHTCSPISLLLQPYSSAAVMRAKLEVSLHHTHEFGFV